jgi:hypothetical protein
MSNRAIGLIMWFCCVMISRPVAASLTCPSGEGLTVLREKQCELAALLLIECALVRWGGDNHFFACEAKYKLTYADALLSHCSCCLQQLR